MLSLAIDIYSMVVLVSVVASWVRLPPDNPIVRVTNMLVEPVLGPLRRILPNMGGLDFSPMVLLIGLRMLKRALIGF